jgi:prophage tail gpP-like protein
LCAGIQLDVVRSGAGSNLGTSANTVFGVWIDNELVTTARADEFVRDVGPTSHEIYFAGRSLGRELVDCQYSITLSGLKLGEIVKRICETFKVPVKIDATTAVVPKFSMQCEQPANALINAVRTANLLLYPLPDGGLILTAPTSAEPVATLVAGDHFHRYRVIDEFKLRFSEYRIKSFDYDGDKSVKGHVADDGLTFFRPMHIVADRHGTGLGSCERRATLERNRRQARAHRLELHLGGWRHAGGIWRINTQVRVIIPGEDIDAVFMIGEVHRKLDDHGGRVTILQVMDRNAFLSDEQKQKTRRGTTKAVRK